MDMYGSPLACRQFKIGIVRAKHTRKLCVIVKWTDKEWPLSAVLLAAADNNDVSNRLRFRNLRRR